MPVRNGAKPVHRLYSTLPRLNRSLRWSTGSPLACSGDMYAGVPAMRPDCVRLASSTVRARPKSVILTRSTPFSSRMLAGLTSRWTRPCACAAARPAAICMPMRRISFTGSGPPRSSFSWSVGPSMNCMTR